MAGSPNSLAAVPPTTLDDARMSNEERAYAYWRGCGLTPVQALRRSGFAFKSSGFSQITRINELESNPLIRETLERIYQEAVQ